MNRRWRKVTLDEIREVQDNLRSRGIWYNGCTYNELVIRYGGNNIKHVRGTGWYKLTAATNPLTTN